MRALHHKRAGLSLIEILIGVTLLGLILSKVALLMRSVSSASASETEGILLEDASREAIRRIGYLLMGANRESLVPDPNSPLYSSSVRFQISLGEEAGQVIWSDPEQIALENGNLIWRRNPGLADEQHVVWSKDVQAFLEGETLNGDDDNGNGLVDEQGLSFVVEGDSVRIDLTLGRQDEDANWRSETKTMTVTCRNKAVVTP